MIAVVGPCVGVKVVGVWDGLDDGRMSSSGINDGQVCVLGGVR